MIPYVDSLFCELVFWGYIKVDCDNGIIYHGDFGEIANGWICNNKSYVLFTNFGVTNWITTARLVYIVANGPCLSENQDVICINGNNFDTRLINLQVIEKPKIEPTVYQHSIRKHISKQPVTVFRCKDGIPSNRQVMAKLTDDEVRYIRANPNNLSIRALSRQFNMDHKSMWLIVHGKTYKDVK